MNGSRLHFDCEAEGFRVRGPITERERVYGYTPQNSLYQEIGIAMAVERGFFEGIEVDGITCIQQVLINGEV